MFQPGSGATAKVLARGLGVLPMEKQVEELMAWLKPMATQIPGADGLTDGTLYTVTTTAGTVTTSTLFSVPPLAIGESYIATLPVDRASPQPATSLTYVTQLINPPGRTDSVPANNRRSSTLDPPTP